MAYAKAEEETCKDHHEGDGKGLLYSI